MKRAGLSGTFWPTPTQESLLRLVLGKDDLVPERWQSLQPLDIDTLDVGSFPLLPHLSVRLQHVLPDEPLVPRLAGTYRSTWYRNQLQLERLGQTAGAMNERGFDPIVFGAAPLAARWYSQPGLRPMPQIDVAVPLGCAVRAREGMRTSGWQPAGEGRHYERFTSGENFVFVVHEGVPPQVAGPLGRGGAFEAVRGTAERSELQNALVTTLAAPDELIFACALGARALTPPSIQWLLDAVCLLSRPDPPGTDRVLARARDLGAVVPVRETLTYLADITDLPPVTALLEALRHEPVSARERYAYQLGGAGSRRAGGTLPSLGRHLRETSGDTTLRVLAGLPRLGLKLGLKTAARLSSRSRGR